MIINGIANPSNLCLPISLCFDKSSSDSAIRPFKSTSLRSTPSYPFLSSIFSCSGPGKGRRVVSVPRTALFAIRNPQSNDEEAMTTFSEEYSKRQSPDEVRKEILDCYKLIDKLRHGAVYFGSARTKIDHSHYLKAKDLAHEVALLHNCTSWTGSGPGMMDAATQEALQAKKPVRGFRIAREAGSWVQTSIHPCQRNIFHLSVSIGMGITDSWYHVSEAVNRGYRKHSRSKKETKKIKQQTRYLCTSV